MPKRILAVLVFVDFGECNSSSSEQEFIQLVTSADALISQLVRVRRHHPDPGLFIGSGKANQIFEIIQSTCSQLVIFNNQLTPVQQRNLENIFQIRVIDRQSLILDIFAKRARSAYGKCQVELAQLEYLSTRLIRAWTHLERQKGGIGLRGPGETQLETDHRLIAERVKYLKSQRKIIKKQQVTQRRARLRRQVFSVSLVGYTNAGKSALFSTLTKQQVYSADQLFATLDTTVRQLYLGNSKHVVLSDTVGFIRGLPHQLIDAFRATLDETAGSNLLLHVIDASNPEYPDQLLEVNKVLCEINADHIRQILVFNKIDLVPELLLRKTIDDDKDGNAHRIFLSATTGVGVDILRQTLSQIVNTHFSQLGL